MRISKANAEAIVIKVTEPLALKTKQAKQLLSEQATKFVEDEVPAEVLKAFKNHSSYIETRSSVYFSGVGLPSCKYINLTKQLPAFKHQHELSPAKAKVIAKLLQSIEDAEKEYKETKLKIESTIIGLGTYARIKDQLPEIEKYLPTSTTTAIALPIADVRKEIRKLTKVA